ncbi:MAG: FKBP-type peptidyl-prolyl cis-trans isomerase [Litorivicinus sp.]
MKPLILAAVMAITPAWGMELETQEQKLSYALGIIVGERIYQDFGELEYDQLIEGIKTAANPESRLMTNDEISEVMQAAQSRMQEQQAAEQQAAAEAAKLAGSAFLQANAEKDGVEVQESGLQVRWITRGTGASPAASDQVQVHYHGTLIDGTVFDSSVDRGEPVTFPVNGVIPGWVEGLQLMKEGDKVEFVIPQDLAYGPGAAGSIPPFSTLVFEVELLKVNP